MSTSEGRQRILITGAAKRIGKVIAFAFAKSGCSVVIHYHHSREEALELLDSIGGEEAGHAVVECDFNDMEQTTALIPRLVERGLKPDCLINNASTYSRIKIVDTTPELAQEIYRVNFFAPFELMRQFAVICQEGDIINITDQRVASVDPDSGVYALAKKSLHDMTLSAALKWAPKIRVNDIAPGIIIPPQGGSVQRMNAILHKIPMQVNSTKKDVAAACIFLHSSPTMTGQTLFIDGGMHLTGKTPETPIV